MTKLHVIVQGTELIGTRLNSTDTDASTHTSEARNFLGENAGELVALKLDQGGIALIRREQIGAIWEE